jgi:hypothetical protein
VNNETPQRDNGYRTGQPSSQARTPHTPSKRGQWNYVRGRVNHVSMEQAQKDSGVVLGTFLVNSIPATVLFDPRASHSFITDQFVTKHNLSMSSMKNPLIVSSPGGETKTGYICPQVKINIMGVDFLANLVVLRSWGICQCFRPATYEGEYPRYMNVASPRLVTRRKRHVTHNLDRFGPRGA